ncbi:HK97 family phage prohead protease [Sinorhizobium meliloti]|uniref:HK97 family phage prohead protease n=1 Tax=Rhizobium meliloti TaxID=382 RepID=UPI000FDAFD4A|nr:HK97 family phage prohead protease [Sinorhizobium meliloti]MDX0318924.1 HK97 family phage prohead protease [Sinorhizobium meliloti]MDX0325480.1 HK97 family phage prohead protease [Sinorhizobium meliloti]RVO65691.1 HK97 family phage prohead protease [Sinorhizobium meliloti]
MTDIEKRGGALGVEFRAESDKRTLTGYAVVWNSDTTIGDYFVERIAPGAFTKALRGDILALVNHDTGRVVGRTRSGTLRLAEDSRGLKVEIDIPDTTDGNDLWTLVERGDVSGMSFSFRATKQEWDDTGDLPHRTVIEAELFEVTATPIPAYPDTSLALRSLEAARTEAAEYRKAENKAAAERRIAGKKAAMEQTFRGITAGRHAS